MTVVAPFRSGCGLMIIDIQRITKSASPRSKARLMHVTCSSRAYLSGRKCQESLALIFVRHRCLHFRLQTGGGCLVVVSMRNWLCRVGGIGHQPMLPTNQYLYFDWKGHTSHATCSCPRFLWMRCLEPTGLHESTRWESTHNLDSLLLVVVCSSHGTKLCSMLITYADHVPATLGRWAFRREASPFSSCHNNRDLEQSPAGDVFELVRVGPIRDVPKRGKIVPKREASQTW